MKKVKIQAALFAATDGRTLNITKVPIKVGMEWATTAYSVHRPASSMVPGIKINYVATITEGMLCHPEDFAAVRIGKMLYMELKDTVAVIEDNTVRITPEGMSMANGLIAAFLQELVFGSNRELHDTFTAVVEDFSRYGKVDNEKVALLCDSYYYGCSKARPEIQMTELSMAEVEQAVRMLGMQNIQELDDLGFRRPRKIEKPIKAEKKRQQASLDDDIIKACREGKYILPYRWKENQVKYIQPPDALEGFIPIQTFRDLLNKLVFRLNRVINRMAAMGGNPDDEGFDRIKAIAGDYVNVTLSGKPGTGKTRLAYALSSATGLPIYTIPLSHNSDEDEIQGLTRIVSGHPTSVQTDSVRCYNEGGILLLEEFNLPQAAVMMGALGQAVEFPFILKKDGYLPIRRHPLCVIIGTMNTGTAGSKVMSQPFQNRFKQSFILNDPTEDDFVRILQNTGAKRPLCKWVYECYAGICRCIQDDNATADVESILLSLSIRSCIGAIENIQEGMEPKDAVKCSLIGKIAEQDMEVALSCERALMSLRDPVCDD